MSPPGRPNCADMTTVDGRTTAYRLRVRWGETDPFGIVFYPSFYTWMDESTHELFRSPDGTFADLFGETGYGFPIAEARCRFLAPAHYDDELTVTSTVTELGTRSFTVEHRFTRGDTELAVGHEVRVFARRHPDDPTRLKAAPIPDPLREFLLGERATPR